MMISNRHEKKRFLPAGIFLLLTILAFFCIPFPASASGQNGRVVFISDSGTGDGSAPDSPLGATTVDTSVVGSPGLCLSSPLYRAIDLLRETGGTVVLCGPVAIKDEYSSSSDFFLPDNEENRVKITSVYDGVDYRVKGGAKLSLRRNLSAGGEIEWEKLTIEPQKFDLKISCEGYETLFGEGISCSTANGTITLVGGGRYKQVYQKDIRLTVLSGTYSSIVGGGYGADSETEDDYPFGTTVADIYLTLGGSTVVTSGVYCTGIASFAPHIGNSNVTITGGNYSGILACTGARGTIGKGYTVKLRILAGTFNLTSLTGDSVLSSFHDACAAKTILDLSEYGGGILQFSKATGFDAILYPSKNISSVSLITPPTSDLCTEKDVLSLDGAVFRATYTIRNADTVFTYAYEDCKDLVFVESIAKDGKVTLSFGGFSSPDTLSFSGKIVSLPEPVLEGAQLKTAGKNQALRFIASLSETDGVEVLQKGIRILPADGLSDGENPRDPTLFGGVEIVSGKDLFVKNGIRYFAGTVSGIPEEEYKTEYTAIAFCDCKIGDETVRIWSEPVTRSVYSTALLLKEAAIETPGVIRTITNDAILKTENNTAYIRPQTVLNEKRETVTSYMCSLGEIVWTNGVKMDYTDGPIEYTAPVYSRGVKLRGLIYGPGKSTVEEWAAALTDGKFSASETPDFNSVTSTSCSHSIFSAYQLISAGTIISGATKTMPVWNPYTVTVGDYPGDNSYATTEKVIASSGKTAKEAEQTIYKAYAELTPGDLLLKWWINKNGVSLGHTILCHEAPQIVANEQGIAGNRSTLLIDEQQSTLLDAENGMKSTWRLKYKITFAELFSQGFVPLTVSALKTGYSETPWCLIKNLTVAEEEISGRILSNYRIRSYEIRLLDKDGKTVRSETFFPHECLSCPISWNMKKAETEKILSGEYSCAIICSYAQRTDEIAKISVKK